MRKRVLRPLIAAAGILLVSLVICCCDDDNPVNPLPAKDYYVYFADELAPNVFYRYNTSTRRVESFRLPYNSIFDGFGVSPDGKKMYLHPDEGIVEVELDSFTVVAEHPIVLKKGMTKHQVLVSPDGRYLALLHYYLHIIDLNDYSVVYSDTVNCSGNGWFTADSRHLLCYINDTVDQYSRIYVLEVSFGDTISAVRHEFAFGAPGRVVATPDYRKWIMLMFLGDDTYRFQVYDRGLDSIIFHTDFCPGGDLDITPGGHKVVYSYSRPGISKPPICLDREYITLFDVVGNEVEDDVYTYTDSLQMVRAVGDIVITPDGRYVVGLSIILGQIFQYDLIRREVAARLQFGDAHILFSPVCQRKP
jgi:hypothetical protein